MKRGGGEERRRGRGAREGEGKRGGGEGARVGEGSKGGGGGGGGREEEGEGARVGEGSKGGGRETTLHKQAVEVSLETYYSSEVFQLRFTDSCSIADTK